MRCTVFEDTSWWENVSIQSTNISLSTELMLEDQLVQMVRHLKKKTERQMHNEFPDGQRAETSDTSIK